MSLDQSIAAPSRTAGAARIPVLKPTFSVRRLGPVLGGIACLTLAVVGTVDPDVTLPFRPRALALAGGLLAGTLVAWLMARRRRASLSRDALVPWWAIGAIVASLALMAANVPIFEHGTFATVTVLRGFLAALGLRFLVDAALGPLPEIPLWGEGELFEAAVNEEDPSRGIN
jgi:hypothetical protein